MAEESSASGLPADLRLKDGRHVTVRTVLPEDSDALQAAFGRLSGEARYARFMAPLRELPSQMLDQATHPAPGLELQLVAIAQEGGQERIVAGARYSAAPGSKDCEFALAVVDAWQRLGLARCLLAELIRAARAAGFERMEGHILASNSAMLRLARQMGFAQVESPEGPSVRMVRRDLKS